MRELNRAERRVRKWVNANKGVLKTVAESMGVSLPYTHRIAYGRTEGPSREGRVERALTERGWPGISSSPTPPA